MHIPIPDWLFGMAKHSHHPWIIKDRNSEIIYANDAWREAVNLPAYYALEGRRIQEIPHDVAGYADQYMLFDSLAMEGKTRVSSMEIYPYGKKREMRCYITSKMTTYDKESNVIGTAMLARRMLGINTYSFIKNKLKPHTIFYPPTTLFTEKEWMVIYLLFCGVYRKEIANILFISIRTVEARINNCMKKIGVNSQTQLLDYCIQHKWDHYIPSYFIKRGHIILR